ncbi:MAG TPA: bifunctional glutamate N-acetyltransferase/amino-acid acetyltransferase ArgJ [Gammaproteobacteria bacterium]|nr:bifunctional glutamate N-acetyltransferase/amino-acid acetyltransferase ArgJ [Gammaproteobacteria bacterium]
MAVGLKEPSALSPVAGVRLAATAAGIRKGGTDDLALLEIASGGATAAVFTRNAFCAAPVILARRHLGRTPPRYLLINAGNANAGTGEQGLADALACCQAVAEAAGCAPEAVLPFSTGVIGEPLPVPAFQAAVPRLVASLQEDGWAAAARAIMTTDTVPKGASRRIRLHGREVTLTGIAKGAGMIRPDMATMLAFVATDAALDPALLQRCLEAAVARSFHCITVDGDTSTNDACVLVATGASGAPSLEDDDDPETGRFREALTDLCAELAQAIVRDGEGATRFITVEVSGGRDEAECRQVACAVAHSPLVKTACFAGDPNWGRILAAVGRAGLAGLDIGGVHIFLGDVCIVAGGARAPDYEEARGAAAMAQEEITIRIQLGRGQAAARIWTCDLSYDYVRINAEYRT